MSRPAHNTGMGIFKRTIRLKSGVELDGKDVDAALARRDSDIYEREDEIAQLEIKVSELEDRLQHANSLLIQHGYSGEEV